jgi:mRNA interferase MazF
VIRGAVYRVDLGDAERGHEQRGRRYGLVLSPTSDWNVATIVPTSTSARPMRFRPVLDLLGQPAVYLVDQIRSVDTSFIQGDPVYYLSHHELMEIETATVRYLGLDAWAGLGR